MTLRPLPQAELQALARSRLGLIVGPGATLADQSELVAVANRLSSRLAVPSAESYLEVGDHAIETGHAPEAVRIALAEELTATTPAPGLAPLARVPWTAVLSLAPDDHFEQRFEEEYHRRAAGRDFTVLTDPRESARKPSLPLFKLLGSATHGELAATTADYLQRRIHWQHTVLAFLEAVGSSPVLVLGAGSSPSILADVLPHLFGHYGQKPGVLVFMEDDPALSARLLQQLVPSTNLAVASGTVSDVIRGIQPHRRNQQVLLDFVAGQAEAAKVDITEFSDVAFSVNHALLPTIEPTERERLLDYLFMPDVPNWDPFAYDLDFERSISPEIEAEIGRIRTQTDTSAVFRLVGAAATGKTMVLKRVAFNLAKGGAHVFWLREHCHDILGRLQSLLRALSAHLRGDAVVLFADIPVVERTVGVETLMDVAHRASVRLILLYGARHSEVQRETRISGIAGCNWELDDQLDDHEWERLPEYLTRIRAFQDEAAAKEGISVITSENRRARDTLAALFFLVPGTRAVIQASIASEYRALGSSSSLRQVIKDSFDASPDEVKRAYGLVAASEKHGAPVPAEVIVRALQVSFAEWIERTRGRHGAAYGLLYGDDEFDPDSSTYRTRNEVVAYAIVQAMNGGSFAREAEMEALHALVSACQGSSPVYSRYLCRVLTPWESLSKAGISYEAGLALYDAAIEALPYEHRTLLHHKALWQRKKGDDPAACIATTKIAMKAPRDLPHGESTEPDEHLCTTAAAAVLERVKRGEIDRHEGQREALRLLEKARSASFLNPNAIHLYAVTVVRMVRDGAEPGDRAIATAQALAEIDKTLLLFRSHRFARLRTGYEASPLIDVRGQLLAALGTQQELEEQAWDLWNKFRIQEGFVLAARAQAGKALTSTDSGRKLLEAFRRWESFADEVRKNGDLGPELAEAGASLYYQWQVRPRSRNAKLSPNEINWRLLQELTRTAIGSPRYAADPFYNYLFGLASAHLDQWDDARDAFTRNRSQAVWRALLQTPLDYLLNQQGQPRRVQGKLKKSATAPRFYVRALSRDFLIEQQADWPQGSQDVHAYVGFSLAGPRATTSDKSVGLDVTM